MTRSLPKHLDLPRPVCTLIVVLVLLAHALLLWFLAQKPNLPKQAPREMSLSVALLPVQAAKPEARPVPEPVAKPEARPVSEPVAKPRLAEPQSVPVQASVPVTEKVAAQVHAPEAEASLVQPVPAPPGLPDREPDYRAAYLHNPAPSYPLVARRMGWQGRVVLNVEVLESGLPGQVRLHQSSGHEVLDNAALQAVKGWRFVAARQGGQAVAKFFLVPIPFIFKEDY